MGNICRPSPTATDSADSDIIRPPPTPSVQEQVPPSPPIQPTPEEQQQQQQQQAPPPTESTQQLDSGVADRYSARPISPSSTSPPRSPASAPISTITGPVPSSSSRTPPVATTPPSPSSAQAATTTTATATVGDAAHEAAPASDNAASNNTPETSFDPSKMQVLVLDARASASSSTTSFKYLLRDDAVTTMTDDSTEEGDAATRERLLSQSLPSINSVVSPPVHSFDSENDSGCVPMTEKRQHDVVGDGLPPQSYHHYCRRVVSRSPFLKGSPMGGSSSPSSDEGDTQPGSAFDCREPSADADISTCSSTVSSLGTANSSSKRSHELGDENDAENEDARGKRQQLEEDQEEAVMMMSTPHRVVNDKLNADA